MDYAALVTAVQTLIAFTGRSTTFQRLSATPADPLKPWLGAGTPTVAATATAFATFVPPAGADLGKELINEEMLARCEQVCLVAPISGFDINTCNAIVEASARWAVQWVYELKPGDTSLLFAIGVKR
jgi:hypothetical protein